MPNLIVMIGLPCSGKSTIANDINKNLNYEILSYDNVREEYCRINGISYNDSFSDVAHNKRITAKYHELREFLVGHNKDIILDNTNIDSGVRSTLDNLFPNYTKSAICINTHIDVCIDRNNNRKWKFIPKKVFESFNDRFEEPKFSEGFKDIYNI